MPASELSEQISTAGKEASGTGNMKFMMNGAVTIGTLDGANVEMHDVLGDENMFLFGLHADQAATLKREGYVPQRYISHDPQMERCLNACGRASGTASATRTSTSGSSARTSTSCWRTTGLLRRRAPHGRDL